MRVLFSPPDITEEEIQDIFYQKHYTDKEKSQICIDVAKVEEKYVNTDKNYVSIYIGMAFCPTRCLYCSFASNPIEANRRTLVRPYLDALKYEIDAIKNYINDKKIKIKRFSEQMFEFCKLFITKIKKSLYNKGFFVLLFSTPMISSSTFSAERLIISKCPSVTGSKLPG